MFDGLVIGLDLFLELCLQFLFLSDAAVFDLCEDLAFWIYGRFEWEMDLLLVLFLEDYLHCFFVLELFAVEIEVLVDCDVVESRTRCFVEFVD